ncbi:hypothetical protein [Micromonospora sp. WMMD710]|uniref:hypothetical protein n=1 Tax=Micromonospora sp. WMMD710 TaxID=3016085 RepID=UPI0024177454|nr:hypothetical protein [Micromonospora sp. WMMD710]MDG4761536.1 hypothetical protein [Micromonospora sp. WMMD710]
MKLPRSVAGWTIAVFGVLALAMGALGLLWPEAQLRMFGFEVPATRAAGDYTGTFLLASSMAAFNMGVYYLLATVTEWRVFYRFTVVFRLVTFTVFTIAVLADIAPDRFFGVAAWEGLGAVATAIGLRLDARRAASGDTDATSGGADGTPSGRDVTSSGGGAAGDVGDAGAAPADAVR